MNVRVISTSKSYTCRATRLPDRIQVVFVFSGRSLTRHLRYAPSIGQYTGRHLSKPNSFIVHEHVVKEVKPLPKRQSDVLEEEEAALFSSLMTNLQV